jgi:ribosomal protein L28
MNKYRSKSKQAERRRYQACGRKKTYASMEEAVHLGQLVYRCRYCGKFHRSGQVATLAAELRRRRGK